MVYALGVYCPMETLTELHDWLMSDVDEWARESQVPAKRRGLYYSSEKLTRSSVVMKRPDRFSEYKKDLTGLHRFMINQNLWPRKRYR
jgi:hypothetical protein